MTRSHRITADVLASLLANKQRSILMMLGLAVGVAVLSASIVAVQGTEERVEALVAKHGLDMIMVRAGGEAQVFAPTADRGLTVLLEGDARAIEDEIPNVRMVSAVQNQRAMNVVYEDRSVTTRGFGVDSDWIEIRRWGMAEGEFISESDLAGMSRVVMMGQKVARALFPEGGAVGRTVRIANDPYLVKGVFVEMGVDAGGDDWDDRIVVPFTTSSRRLFNRPYLEQIVMLTADARQLPETAARIRELLRVRHSIAAGEPDDFFVREPADVEDAALDTSSTLSTLSLAIAIAALIAGGLVIMNVMLSAVSQRRHEIGLRRAMGARASDIQRQFLLESLLVALAGGLVGVVAGIAIASGLAAAQIMDGRLTWVPFVAALIACTVIGLVFGVYPARRAAAVEAATTLRQQAI